MKLIKRLSDYAAFPAWKILYDKNVNKQLKNIITDFRPYYVYTALLFQELTDAPVATVLENTFPEGIIGEYSYDDLGVYLLPLDLSTEQKNKIAVFNGSSSDTAGDVKTNYSKETLLVTISTFYNGEPSNGILSDSDGFKKTLIEIRLYK